MLGNVCPNMVMDVLQNLIKTPLYKYLNIAIHHQWANLFALHMNLEYQIPIYNIASSDNFDSNNEGIHCTPTYSMIHNFLYVPKIMDYENTIYSIAPNQNFHPLSLFQINIQKSKIFQHYSTSNFNNFLKVFHINENYFINLEIFQQIFLTFF
jgi:hypothetical protein